MNHQGLVDTQQIRTQIRIPKLTIGLDHEKCNQKWITLQVNICKTLDVIVF